jgi:hypothetical protein
VPTIGFTYWQDEEMWLGHLDETPEYVTQGMSVDDLREHLLDLYRDLSSIHSPKQNTRPLFGGRVC